METPDLLIAGREAFASQGWAGTVAALGMAGPLPPDASEVLAKARWWLDDPGGAIAAWEVAYTGYLCDAGTRRAAARVAVTIASTHLGSATRLRPTAGSSEPQIRCPTTSRARSEAGSRSPRPNGRTIPPRRSRTPKPRWEPRASFGDTELEIQGLAAMGRGRVHEGRISEGMDLLDAALAAATGGETEDPRVLGDVFCDGVEACTLTADMSRVERWLEVFNSYGAPEHGGVMYVPPRESASQVEDELVGL